MAQRRDHPGIVTSQARHARPARQPDRWAIREVGIAVRASSRRAATLFPMPASVRKAALVLDLFSVEHPHWGPSDVAGELGIAKSTAHALLAELTSAGLTERLPCGRYRLGWRTLGLARA